MNLTVESYLRGPSSRRFASCFPKFQFWKGFEVSICVSACRAESIGIMFVDIGLLVAKLFLKVFFTEKILATPLAWNLELLWLSHFLPLADLNRSVCWLWKSLEQLQSYSKGIFHENSRSLSCIRILRLLMFLFCPACSDVSISILFVKIGRTVE
jgi:hypothetical protein